MKNLIILAFAGLCLIGTSACTVSARYPKHNPKKEQTLPPGQVKKITGEKSAAPYAPGHNK